MFTTKWRHQLVKDITTRRRREASVNGASYPMHQKYSVHIEHVITVNRALVILQSIFHNVWTEAVGLKPGFCLLA